MRAAARTLKTFSASLAASAAVLTAVPATAGLMAVVSAPSVAAQTGGEASTLLPDASLRSDLTVHFRDSEYTDIPATGEELSNPPGTGSSEGSVVILYRVDTVDLRTPAGWQTALDMVPGDVGYLDRTKVGEATVGADGVVSFTDLPLGLYLVAPRYDATVTAVDFLVFLPSATVDTEGNPTGWNTDVHAYPKSSPVELSSRILSMGNAGEPVVAEHVLPIPTTMSPATVATGDAQLVLSEFGDTQMGRADLESLSVMTRTGGRDVELVRDVDYTVQVEEIDDEADRYFGQQVVEVTLTQSGLGKAATADSVAMQLARVVTDEWTVTGTASGMYEGSYALSGMGSVRVGHEQDTGGVSGVAVYSEFGDVSLSVTNGLDGSPLAGAQFQVYTAPDDATHSELMAGDYGAPEMVRGTDTWTTDADGELVIDGLAVYDETGTAINYVAVQTGFAPGFADTRTVYPLDDFVDRGTYINTSVTPVTEIPDLAAKLALLQDGKAPYTSLAVSNYTTAGTDVLPATGGAGVGLVLGLAAAVAAGGYAVSRRRGDAADAVDTGTSTD